MELFLAIDGGGSKTEGLLLDALGNVINRICIGPTNPNDIGPGESAERLSALCGELLGGKRATSLYAGISGAIGNESIIQKAVEPFGETATVGSDSMNLLAFAGERGACLIAGTGSVCFARKGTQLKRFGGWGYLLDGAGGGYDIGRSAISASLLSFDGRGKSTSLYARLTEILGDFPERSIPKIYSGGKAYIASFAPVVFEESKKGDAVSNGILERNADYLAELVFAAKEFLGEDFETVVGGSLFTKQEMFFSMFKERLPKGVRAVIPDKPPVYGAFLEAVRFSGRDIGYDFPNFDKTYERFIK